ncbi:hypothetical protein [Limibacterium fermenti]|uniref:hypothetical protein n=1 Tax=Limibacterium fermenti TaxID=3229863 RepID=UPI003A609D26
MMTLLSEIKWDSDSRESTFTDRNFEAATDDGLLHVFRVYCLIEQEPFQNDRDSEPETRVTDEFYSVFLKESWKDDYEVKLPLKWQTELEEELEAIIRAN